MRRRLPPNVKMYTGDDFNYPELIQGDEQGYSHALLGIFDAIAPAASAAFQALDAGDLARYNALLAPTVPLSRHIFQAPTFYYKTGVVFLAYLNGHQSALPHGRRARERALDRPPGRAVRAGRPRRRCCATPSWPPRASGRCWRWRGLSKD